MGVLSNLLQSIRKKDRGYRILILGLDSSGKTSVLRRLAREDTTRVTPTKGFCIQSLIHDGLKLDVWDVGGQKALRPYWRTYYERADALIYVIDSADHRRLE